MTAFVISSSIAAILPLFAAVFGRTALVAMCATSMSMTAIFGGYVIDFIGWPISRGNAPYAAALSCMAIYIVRAGDSRYVARAVQVVFVCMITVTAWLGISDMLGDRVSRYALRVSGVSYLAFAAASFAMAYVLLGSKKPAGAGFLVAAMCAGEIVDGIVFFPLAFAGEMYASDILDLTLSGTAIKCSIHVAMWPLLAAFKPQTEFKFQNDSSI